MNLQQMRERLARLRGERDEHRQRANDLIDTAEAAQRDLTDEEWTRVREANSDARELETEISQLESDIQTIEEAQRSRPNRDGQRQRDDDADAAANGREARAADEGGTEHDAQRGARIEVVEPGLYDAGQGNSFFRDMALAQRGDPAAQDRLGRHRGVMVDDLQRRARRDDHIGRQLRAVATGDLNGLIAPVYLLELYADNLFAGLQWGQLIRDLPLPDQGMVFNIPRAGTAATTDAQAGQAAAVSNTDADSDTDLEVHVETIAGVTDHTFQLRDRGGNADQLILMDLREDYFTKLDRFLLSGTGHANNQHTGVLNAASVATVTYTSASPTGTELLSKIAEANSTVASARFLPATAIVMHSRRWFWLTQQRDSDGRPLVTPVNNGPANADGTVTSMPGTDTGPTLVGYIGSQPVYTVENIPTNLGIGTDEDAVIVSRLSDILGWGVSAMPVDFMLQSVDRAGGGAEKLVCSYAVYGFSAFTAERRPESTAVITGTGLVAPTF